MYIELKQTWTMHRRASPEATTLLARPTDDPPFERKFISPSPSLSFDGHFSMTGQHFKM